jgi:hypothetical protein
MMAAALIQLTLWFVASLIALTGRDRLLAATVSHFSDRLGFSGIVAAGSNVHGPRAAGSRAGISHRHSPDGRSGGKMGKCDVNP